jgi:hypothetical protein
MKTEADSDVCADVRAERIRDDHRRWLADQSQTAYRAYFQDTDLRNAYFLRADLRHACFLTCDLRGADIRNIDLLGADLRGADLANQFHRIETGCRKIE